MGVEDLNDCVLTCDEVVVICEVTRATCWPTGIVCCCCNAVCVTDGDCGGVIVPFVNEDIFCSDV